jgi:cation transport ATPase
VTIGAAAAIARIRKSGRQVFLVSSAPEASVSEQAKRLGIELSSGELDHQGRIRFLEGLHARGIRPAYVGSLVGRSDLARSAYVSLQMPGFSDNANADIVLLGHSYQNLAALIEQVGSYDSEIQQATRAATLPNLLCVAGAFGGVLNGITSGIIANIGVLRVDRHLDKTLADADTAKANPGRLLLDKSSLEL